MEARYLFRCGSEQALRAHRSSTIGIQLSGRGPRRSVMRPSVRAFEDRNSCDYCRCYLANCRLIAGGADDRRQFCSFPCYDRWHAQETQERVELIRQPRAIKSH